MDGIELMAGAMRAARARLDVATANLANVSSDGFRKRVAHAELTGSGIVISTAVDDAQAPLRRTGRPFDLAVAGNGAFAVRAPGGHVSYVRSASFERDEHGYLVDESGRRLVDERGAVRVAPGATIDSDGTIRDRGERTGRMLVRAGTEVRSGFIAGANVDAIGEMVDILCAQRSYETAQQALSAIDRVRSKEASDLARVKS